MTVVSADQSFFVTGGTLSVSAPSYIERQADRDLFAFMKSGEFCYVLNSRQMGKSSLSVRTMAKLEAEGIKTVFIDLTKLGGKNVTAEQWYAGLLAEIGRALGLRQEFVKYFVEHKDVGPMQRLFGALREVGLEQIKSPICIFIDEIDATRALSFSTDEFFAGIRECYNRRVHDPEFQRLTFCLLGVAAPKDLIQDSRTTPFNIGKNVVLRDFQKDEAMQLAQGLGPEGPAKLERVLYWTGGQPFLTQTICAALAADPTRKIDELVHETFLEKKARLGHVNLADVGNRVLNGYESADQIDPYRAEILQLVQRIRQGKRVPDDDKNHLITVLRLSGLVKVEDGLLRIRNRIYERVFDQEWIEENMPGQELRRQRRAFRLGVVRTASIAGVIVLAMAVLSVYSFVMARRADRSNRLAQYELYVANVNLMQTAWAQNDVDGLRELLDQTRNHPAKGWEWQYWHRLANLQLLNVRGSEPGYGPMYSPDGREIAMRYPRSLAFFDSQTGKELRRFEMPRPSLGYAIWTPDGKSVLDSSTDTGIYLYDARTGEQIWHIQVDQHEVTLDPFTDDGKLLVTSPTGSRGESKLAIWNADDGTPYSGINRPGFVVHSPSFVGGTRQVFALQYGLDGSGAGAFIYDIDTDRLVKTFKSDSVTYTGQVSKDGRFAAIGTMGGWVEVWDVASGQRLSRVKAHEGTVSQLDWSKDSKWLTTVASDRLAKIWSVGEGKLEIRNDIRGAGNSTFAPDANRILAGYFDIRVYDPFTYRESISHPIPHGLLGALYIDPTGKHWTLDSGALLQFDPTTSLPNPDPIGSGVVSDDGRFLLLEDDQKGYRLVRLEGRETLCSLEPMSMTPMELHVSASGDRFAILFDDQTVGVYNGKTGRLIRIFDEKKSLMAADVSPDGKTLVTGGMFGAVTLWSVDTGEVLKRTAGHNRSVESTRFAENGTRMITTGDDDLARIWDVATGDQLLQLAGHSQTVFDARFSPDMRRIVTASRDMTAKVWDAATGRELLTLSAGDGELISAQFTPDGRTVVTSGADGVVRLWLSRHEPTYSSSSPQR